MGASFARAPDWQHDLTGVARTPEAEGDSRRIYTWEGRDGGRSVAPVRTYLPSSEGMPRLVAAVSNGSLGVWDNGTGAFRGALQNPKSRQEVRSLVTYQRPSDGRPRVAAGSAGGYVCIWDGNDFQLLHTMRTNPEGVAVRCLGVYDEPTSGNTRLVTG
jgi:WD40 repeat protein